MGKKDAAANRGTPVDQYRKNIGKQDYKKSKKEIKLMKQKADNKASAFGVKEVVMILIAILSLVAALYMFLYWNLSKDDIIAD